ncbi:MAG: hypothetical protein NTX50_10270 [Candidatus Sumerlaeota bacterium]|nr:hypothetical protein [Candidatus Sumerlaeota bacterium]
MAENSLTGFLWRKVKMPSVIAAKKRRKAMRVGLSAAAFISFNSLPPLDQKRVSRSLEALEANSIPKAKVRVHPQCADRYVLHVSPDLRLFYEHPAPKMIQVLDIMTRQAMDLLAGKKDRIAARPNVQGSHYHSR